MDERVRELEGLLREARREFQWGGSEKARAFADRIDAALSGAPLREQREEFESTPDEHEEGRGPWHWAGPAEGDWQGPVWHLFDGRGSARCGADIPGRIREPSHGESINPCLYCKATSQVAAQQGRAPQAPPNPQIAVTRESLPQEECGVSMAASLAKFNEAMDRASPAAAAPEAGLCPHGGDPAECIAPSPRQPEPEGDE